ncbi:MAG: alkaline phosphatase family protein [Acidimicrobiales bacterium]
MVASLRSRALGLGVSFVALSGALTMAAPGRAATAARRTGGVRSARSRPIGRSHIAAAGTNLLVNAGAEAGDASGAGWDAVTVPGWQVVEGLPTVVRYGTAGFPSRSDAGPSHRGRQLFAGGAGGTAELVQDVALQIPNGQRPPAVVDYDVSAWLGGTKTSDASVRLQFLSAADRSLGSTFIGPVGRSGLGGAKRLALRQLDGSLPAGTAEVEVGLVLATSLTDDDGPDAPQVGYDRAVADNLSFSVSAAVVGPPVLAPPAAQVPRFDHVFVYYFENEDFRSVIGNSLQAPYLNSLLPRSSLLADLYAEEHPSDGNYLALAGGSTFGIPLTDPLEENPTYTINARNLGDLLEAAHESWKGYLQSANGPCDDTVHGWYWDDDLPFLYFRDVRKRPAYCATHLVPLAELSTDLKETSTTPSFAWVSPNDCDDMEGCGITAGDTFLAQTLGEILRSPAWTTQRSLVIITFDEDGYDFERPAQLVPTIILGSQDVRQGWVSMTRYTHYSLLRTIEAALGLGTLTDNDLYAQPVNDVFDATP